MSDFVFKKIILFRRGWTVSLQYLISLWIELAEDNRVVSFIKVSVSIISSVYEFE